MWAYRSFTTCFSSKGEHIFVPPLQLITSFLISLQCVCGGLPELAGFCGLFTKYLCLNLMSAIVYFGFYIPSSLSTFVLSLQWVYRGWVEDVSCLSPWIIYCLLHNISHLLCVWPIFQVLSSLPSEVLPVNYPSCLDELEWTCTSWQ